MNLHRVGLIVNPSAGAGRALEVARRAMAALSPHEVIAGAGEMGAEALSACSTRVRQVDWSPHTGKERTRYLTEVLSKADVDALVVVGGDGTLADVAFALYQEERAIPLLGIGTGSANVGPLMTCRGDQVGWLANARFHSHMVDGLLAGLNRTSRGLAFNDVVLGFTVLATVDGKVVDVDVAAKMRGLNLPREPEPIGTDEARVVKNSDHGETLVACGNEIATVIAGFPDERFYGKAIAGGVLLSGLVNDPAGCLVCDHLLVRTRMDPEWYRRSEPVNSHYVGLNEEERIEAWGLRPGTALCADGNPLAILNAQDRVDITVRRALVQSIQIERT